MVYRRHRGGRHRPIADQTHGYGIQDARKETAAPVETAHRSITICHLGNIAMRLGRDKLRWDPVKEQFVGDKEANQWLDRPKRGPWKV